MALFKQKVIEIVKTVPSGKVVSYGQVALMAGIPRAARQVGWILNSMDEPYNGGSRGPEIFPWWRVINNEGRISIKGTKYNGPLMQKKLLKKEGVLISDDLTFDIEKYRWRPDVEILQRFELDDDYIQKFIEKYL